MEKKDSFRSLSTKGMRRLENQKTGITIYCLLISVEFTSFGAQDFWQNSYLLTFDLADQWAVPLPEKRVP